MKKLPFIISIPNSGKSIPKECKTGLQVTPQDIFSDADPFAGDIFDVQEHALSIVKSNVAQTLVDVNSHATMLPPEYPDGIFKTKTSDNKTVYKQDMFPDEETQTTLLEKYYFPYHQKIENDLKHPDVVFGFDCHSMAETGPANSPDPGEKRPMVCINNLNGQACDNRMTRMLVQCFQQYFGVDSHQIKVNYSCNGDFIISEYGYNPIPWVQIDINRALYMHQDWYNHSTRQVEPKRLQTLNYLFLRTLTEFSKQI